MVFVGVFLVLLYSLCDWLFRILFQELVLQNHRCRTARIRLILQVVVLLRWVTLNVREVVGVRANKYGLLSVQCELGLQRRDQVNRKEFCEGQRHRQCFKPFPKRSRRIIGYCG